RDEVERELLQRNCAAIAQAAMNLNRASGNHHDRGEVERVKGDPGNHAAPVHRIDGKSKNVSAVTEIAFQPEMHPAKHQREGNHRGNYAAPHDEKVHGPTREAAPENESLLDEVGRENAGGGGGVANEIAAAQIQIPTPLPIHPRGRTL